MTTDESLPVPNWLLKLEEQRERRLKVRLGHEAGAGAKCQKCGDKCPGLDLHFWRKICKACKCGKEDHDIIDDDIYGFVQFQLLGSKPVKSKGVFLKGQKDEVILEWTPKGSSNDVKKYLDELPAEMIPVKGSEAAKLRKQMLQKQMPAHDIDASLCHALTPEEIKELEEYVAHIRKHSVGQGKIVRLSLLKGNQHKIPPKPQILTEISPKQIASSETVFLQPSDILNLHNLTLKDKSNQSNAIPNYTPQNLHQIVDNQNPTEINYYYGDSKNIVHPLTTTNVERHQEQFENANFNPQQNDLKYFPKINNAYSDKVSNPLLEYNPSYVNPIEQNQLPVQVNQPKDVIYEQNEVLPSINNATHPLLQQNQNYVDRKDDTIKNKVRLPNFEPQNVLNPLESNQNLKQSFVHDLNYPIENFDQTEQELVKSKVRLPNFEPQNVKNPLESDQSVKPAGFVRDLTYPVHQSSDVNYNCQKTELLPTLQAQHCINPLESHQNIKSVGYIRDLAYPVENLDSNVNYNNQKCHGCQKLFDENAVAITTDRSTNLWHSQCFNCHTCQQPLADLLYFYHKDTDNIYCGRDYAILKGIPRCSACDELIFVREYCLAENNTFHVKHFCCFECDEPLAGKEYVMENNQPVCISCFESIKAEKCQDCGYVIGPDQEGAVLQNLHWHASADCFACKLCRKSLLGAKILLRNNNLFCSHICFKSY